MNCLLSCYYLLFGERENWKSVMFSVNPRESKATSVYFISKLVYVMLTNAFNGSIDDSSHILAGTRRCCNVEVQPGACFLF